MKTFLNALLFAAMTIPAVAQRYEPAQLPTPDHSSPKEMDIKGDAQKPLVIRPADVVVEEEPKSDEEIAAGGSDAERRTPTADTHLSVTFWGVRDENLQLKVEASELNTKFLCLVIASLEDTMMNLPGLPPLLMTETIVASGLDVGAFSFDMGPAKLPFTVFAQAVITDGARIAASGVLKVEPAL